MEIQIGVVFLSIIVFLFTLYVLGKEDTLFIRKSVEMEMLFNIAFLVLIIGLLGARMLHILLNFTPGFLNPLVFLAIPYFPGLSVSGGVMVGLMWLVWYIRKQKFPLGRCVDFFLFAFITALVFSRFAYHGIELIQQKFQLFPDFLFSILYTVVLILFASIFFPKQRSGLLKDGTIGLLLLLTFSIFTFILNLLSRSTNTLFIFNKEDIIPLILIGTSIYFLVKHNILKLRKINS